MDNKIMMTGIGIVGVVLLIAIAIGIGAMLTYNSIQSLSLDADNQWGKVQTVYQERFDLIPRIVSSVNAQTNDEKEVIAKIANARAHYISGQSPQDKIGAAQELDRAVTSFFPIVLQENYPNLQFAEAFRDFRVIYEGQENRIRVERNRYNDAVTEYNKAIRTFPGSIFAGMFGFKEKTLFSAQTGAENAPEVNFN
ncbi:MAG: LemA family protein [Candidatus Bilamarchaeum sp.]